MIFCEAGIWDELLIVDGLLAAEGHAQWRDGSQRDPQCALCLLTDLDRL